ncbi:MAG: DNA primase [Firmicutes bacterium]|nr:DNA primase [Bacillota bacterium]
MIQRNSGSGVEDLKSQLNISDVIGRVVPLKRAGSNFKGVCPFHNEKTPSFVVSDQKQIFTCFGCGATGDVIEFTKRYYNLDFVEACEKLGKEYGIEVNLRNASPNKDKDRLYNINREAARFFYKAFTGSANPGYTYMKKRGMDDAILKKFGIGYADREWDSLYKYLKSKGAEDKDLLDLGLISRGKDGKYYDKFRHRVIFPIINTSGKVIGFGGRRIDENDNPKYLNSPENLIFQKKNNLYALNITKQEIGKEGNAILVEGYMDVISLYQSGVRNVAASLGTALTENQAKLIKRYTANVSLCYDADNAGIAAALRGVDILTPAGLKVKVFHVTDGKDPDEYAKAHGRDAFMDLVKGAPTAVRYKLDSAKKGIDLEKDSGKVEYMKLAADILRKLSPVEMDIYVRSLAEELRISERAILKEIEQGSDPPKERKPAVEMPSSESFTMTNTEANVISALLINSDLTEKLFDEPGIMESPFAKKIENIIFELFGTKGSFELEDITDRLDPNESQCLNDILSDIHLAGKEEQVLIESIRKWKLDVLYRKEKEIVLKMDLADESEIDQDMVKSLTEELMEVQKDIYKYGGR